MCRCELDKEIGSIGSLPTRPVILHRLSGLQPRGRSPWEGEMKKRNKCGSEGNPDRREKAIQLDQQARKLINEIMDLYEKKRLGEKAFLKLKKVPGKMRRVKEEFERSQRGRWRWECIRRNKDYIHDFELSKKDPYNHIQKRELEKKWHIPEEFLDSLKEAFSELKRNDPEHMEEGLEWSLPDPERANFDMMSFFGVAPEPNMLKNWTSFLSDYFGRNVAIFRPGHLEFIEGGWRTSEHWEIDHGSSEYAKLTEENCPRQILLGIEIQPWFSKETIKQCLIEKFDEAYELLKDAQAAVLKKKTLGPRDDDSFTNFMIAYDYQQKGLNITEIALKMFPDTTYENKKRTRIFPKPEAKKM